MANASAPAIRKAGAEELPPRIVLAAVEGWGKTTLGAFSPQPIFMQARGETGLETLRSHRLVPDVDTFDVIESWPQAIAVVEYLIGEDTGHKTLVLDAKGGFERLCHEHVCQRDFGGDWGEKGFSAFQKGYDLSIHDWAKLLERLDRLRATRGMAIVMLSHCRVATFKNPTGPDFDRYGVDCHQKTWGITHKWADAVLFGNFFTVVQEKKGQRAKGIGGQERVLYTQHSDVHDAKNRYGMPPEIDVPSTPAESWNAIAQYLNTKGTL